MPSKLIFSLPATPSPPPPLPPQTTRTFLPTPGGPLELLSSHPKAQTVHPPLLFVHGGFGSALCYANYLPYFSSRGYTAYSVSLRAHGQSYNPGYWRTYFTPRSAFVADIAAAVKFVRETEGGKDPVIVGHSAGGGCAQDLVSRGERVAGMVLLAAIPGSGSYEAPQTKLPCPTNRDRFEVNSNWMKMDAYFIPRMIFHLFHPRSPLSSTALVRSAFFSASCPTEIVVACEDNMAKWESMVWPMSMMWKFVDPTAVMRGISGEGVGGDGRKILIVNGEEDQLVGVRIGTDLAECYRKASDGGEERVLYMGLKGSGHHLMLDTKWEDGAGLILGWLE